MSDIKKVVNIIAKCESVFSHIVVLNLTKDLTFSHDTKIQNDKRLYKMIKSACCSPLPKVKNDHRPDGVKSDEPQRRAPISIEEASDCIHLISSFLLAGLLKIFFSKFLNINDF